MNRKNKYLKYCFLFFTIISIKTFAQSNAIDTLSELAFFKMVEKYHPVAKQADLITSNASASIMAARGNFDFKLYSDFRTKQYDGTTYYNLGNGGLVIPTWYGVDFKLGYEKGIGNYINPENKTGNEGLFFSQISLPVLQGFVIDERRATLKKAKLFESMSSSEKTLLLNDLLYQAGKSYWNWCLSYSNLQVYKNSVTIAQQRFEAIKKTVELGDRPLIDTVEAHIQLQERVLSFQQATLDFKNQSLLLSNFLWYENNVPLEITDKLIPEFLPKYSVEYQSFSESQMIVDAELTSHPTLTNYEFKIKQLEIDRKVKKDKLKPILNLQYNPLYVPQSYDFINFNNYKWGLSFLFPLFLRKERAELKMANIKLENTRLELSNKKNELVNKIKAARNEFSSLQIQHELYVKTVENYEKLWLSEKALFETGESSLFLMNSREMSYISSQLKLNDLFVKSKKARLELNYAKGILSEIN